MSYQERNTWAQLGGAVVTAGVFLVLTPWTRTDWLWTMAWAIAAGALVAILSSITWNLAAGVRRLVDTRADERDTHIAHIAHRLGQTFLVIAAIVAMVLCGVSVAPFWIAQTLFIGFVVSALAGGLASVIMYRTGAA